MAKDTKERILTGLTEIFTRIFAGMMEKGLMCDREPDKTKEAIARVEAFSRHFIKTYEKDNRQEQNDLPGQKR